jgi:hypothetical protein
MVEDMLKEPNPVRVFMRAFYLPSRQGDSVVLALLLPEIWVWASGDVLTMRPHRTFNPRRTDMGVFFFFLS